jgi:hypothetical protein
MEHAASLPSSPARNDDSLNHSRASSPQEDIQDITSFVTMLKFNSDKVKLEAASALLHVLSINHANTGKNDMKTFNLSKYETLRYSYSSNTLMQLLNAEQSLFCLMLWKVQNKVSGTNVLNA